MPGPFSHLAAQSRRYASTASTRRWFESEAGRPSYVDDATNTLNLLH